ncbi:MAG: dTMP kinase [Clostridia bacterium]|nr:dTMP kinase [Clostridia bacterium]
MRPFDYIVFDFDGTIAESGPGIMACAREAVLRLGYPEPDVATLRRFIGPPLYNMFREAIGMDDETAQTAVKYYRERYGVIGMFEATIYEGITPMLRALKREGVYLAVASGKPDGFLKKIIDHFGLTEYFSEIRGSSPDNRSGDKAALLRSVLPADVDLSRVCMVGDRCFDIDSGKAVGVYTVAVGYGYGSKEEFEASGADKICETVKDLQSCLLGDVSVGEGRFISFEGTDGCGKSTQIKRVAEYYRSRGYEIVMTREPGGCPISERIREIILSLDSMGMSAECEALLYAASRIEHVKRVILPALDEGKIVLCDRFLDSSIVYQGAGRELGVEFVRQINAAAEKIARPDVTLLFEIDRSLAKTRVNNRTAPDRLELEKEEFYERIAVAYDRLATAEPERIRRIDASKDVETVYRSVLTALNEIKG